MHPSTPTEFVHVPTPGDHYSPATGSAVMTIIYEISRVHARHGGRTRIIVSHGTRHDYEVGQCVEVPATNPPSRWKRAVDAGMARVCLPRRFASKAFMPASKAIEPEFGGVLFLHNSPAAVGLFRRRCSSARVCLWAHNELFKTYADRETRRVVEDADFVICVSEFVAADIRRRVGGKLSEKVVVVHNGVDTNRFHPAAAEAAAAGKSAQAPIILFLGRVNPVKGVDLLLKAACKIRARDRQFTVRIVGSSNFSASDPLTPYELELRRLAAPLGDAVQFQPFVDRAAVVGEYQRATVFCAPANWDEPFGLTLAEAMACGLAVVTSRRGGIPEVCGDAALYFDPPDVDALAERLSRVLDVRSERDEWGRRARQRADDLTWDRQYAKLCERTSSRDVPAIAFMKSEAADPMNPTWERAFSRGIQLSADTPRRKIMKSPVRMLSSGILRVLAERFNIPIGARAKTFWGDAMSVWFPDEISKLIYQYGFFEEKLTRMVLAVLKPGDVMFDVGAHYGYFTLLGSRLVGPDGSVHSFEPTPSTFQTLVRNVSGRPNIQPNNVAVATTNGRTRLKDFGHARSAYNSVEAGDAPDAALRAIKARTHDVPTVSLDRYMSETGVAPGFVKIDAEGSELRILHGMEQILKEVRPLFSLEVGGVYNDGARSREVLEFAASFGYRAFNLVDGRLVLHEIRDSYQYDNILMVPEGLRLAALCN